MQSPPKGKITGSTPVESAIDHKSRFNLSHGTLKLTSMNLLLLQPAQIKSASTAIPSDAQIDHILNVLKLETGGTLEVGLLNDKNRYGHLGCRKQVS